MGVAFTESLLLGLFVFGSGTKQKANEDEGQEDADGETKKFEDVQEDHGSFEHAESGEDAKPPLHLASHQ